MVAVLQYEIVRIDFYGQYFMVIANFGPIYYLKLYLSVNRLVGCVGKQTLTILVCLLDCGL